MKLGIMQPYFFPYIGYFQLINSVDIFVIYDDVNYIKQGWVNRNNLLINKQKHLFTLPLDNPSSFSKINEIDVNPKFFDKWRSKFLQSIEQSYKKAPYFEPVFAIIKDTLFSGKTKIAELSTVSITLIAKYLEMDTEIRPSSTMYQNNHLKAQDRVIDICKRENATRYSNPIGGKDLYSKTKFNEHGIDLKIITSNPITYKQFGNEFVSGLSIIDVLMFNSVEETKKLLKEFELHEKVDLLETIDVDLQAKNQHILIAGAKGLAKEVLEVVYKQNPECNITFFDNISNDLPRKLFGRFSILRDVKEVEHYFNTVDKKFTIGIGNPLLRKAIHDMFVEIGGEYVSTISNASEIGSFDVEIGKGTNVLSHAIFSNSVRLGIGCLVYYRTTITHDCVVGDFVEMSPGVTLLGRCKVGSYSQIGSNATILPKVKIGRNVIVGAGAVVTKDVPDNSMVVGVPAKIIRKLEPLVDEIKSKKKVIIYK